MIYVHADEGRSQRLTARRLPREQQLGINLLCRPRDDVFLRPCPVSTGYITRFVIATNSQVSVHDPILPPHEELLHNIPRFDRFTVAHVPPPWSPHAFALQHSQEFVDDGDVVLGDVVHPAIQGKRVVEKAGVRGVGGEDGRGFAEEVAEENIVVEERPGEVGVDGSGDF